MNPTLEDVRLHIDHIIPMEEASKILGTDDDFSSMMRILKFCERVLLAQAQGGKMLPPDIATEKADIRRLYMTMHQNTPDMLAEKKKDGGE